MKKLFLALLIATRLFAADAANDLILSQRKSDNSGNIQRNLAPTARGLFTFDASKIPASTTDLTYTTPTLSVPDAFNVSSAGSISLTAGGSNKTITVKPTGTGVVEVLNNTTSMVPSFSASSNGIQITPADANNAQVIMDSFAASPSYIGRRANGTQALPTALTNGNSMAVLSARGYGATGYSTATRASVALQARGTWTDTNQASAFVVNIVPLQSTDNATTSTALAIGSSNGPYFAINTASVEYSVTAGAAATFGMGIGYNTSTFYNTSDSGTVATGKVHVIRVPTLTAASVMTYTDTHTFYIDGAPTASTNVTQTRAHALTVKDSTSSTTSITGAFIVATTVGTAATSVGIGGGNITAGGNIDTTSGEIRSAGNRVNYNLAAYGTGTVYTLTNTAAAVALGTTSPSITLDKAGTYMITGRIQLAYTGATVVAETATVKLRRTNNTPADLTSGSTVIDLPVATTLTYTYGTVQIPPVIYSTSNTNDIVTIFANVSATLGAGTITAEAGGTNLMAVRMY